MQQMKLDPVNPVLKKEIYNTIVGYLGGLFTCPDYDDTRYGVEYREVNNTIYFSFRIPNFKDIYTISGEYLLKKHYSDFNKEAEVSPGFDITISKSLDFIQELPKIKNPTPQDEENKKKIKDQNKANIDKVVEQLSKFRVNFLSSPYEQAFDQVKEGKSTKFSFTLRQGDRVWCTSDPE